MNEFTKEDILKNLELIAKKLKSSNKTADIGIYGGSAAYSVPNRTPFPFSTEH